MKQKMKDGLILIKKHKIALILFSIILLGAYLRLNDFSNLARFNADQVRDAKIVDAMFDGEFPLLGPKAGGTTFNLGPAFYYLQYISGLVFGNTPEGISIIVPVLAVASIYVFYVLLKSYFSINISLILTFLYSTSYYAIRYTKFAWNPNAIPFFLFAFLLSILKILENEKSKRLKWNILSGIIMGLAMQLHTTLLILMPTIFLLTHIYLFFKEKKMALGGFMAAISIILALHIPFFLYDIRNNGENMTSFFQGTATKTEKDSSVIANLFLDGQFFLQGNTFVLTGQEPEKNWTKPLKLIASKDISEIALFSAGTMFFIFGLILIIKELKNEKDKRKKEFLMLISLSVALSFILFFPIAKELNLRFFMILILLPFIFFGIIANFAAKKLGHEKLVLLMMLALALGISIANIATYKKTYDLSNYKAKESLYGGISLGEAREIHGFMSKKVAENPSRNYYLKKFEFERSIEYFNEKDDLKIREFKNEVFSDEILFVILKKTELETYQYSSSGFDLIGKETFSRFTILALKAKDAGTENSCKIGFITDIHASYSKSSENFIRKESSLPLETFVKKMDEKFKPDFIVQGGDLIDGREKSNDTAKRVLDSSIQYFSKLKFPTLHIMGNHETRSGGLTLKQWLDMTGNTSTYYAKDCKDTRIIILDGTDSDKAGYYSLSEKQMDWLKKTLESSRDMRKIVFSHIPLITRAEMSPNLKFEKEFEPQQSSKIKKLLENNGVSMIISGHNEFLYRKNENNLIHQVLPGIFKSKDEKISWYDSFAEITIGNAVDIDYYYKKDRSQKTYQTLEIPSKDFDNIVK